MLAKTVKINNQIFSRLGFKHKNYGDLRLSFDLDQLS